MIGLILLSLSLHGIISSGQVVSVAELSSQSQAKEDEATVTKRGALVIQNGRPDAQFEHPQAANPLDQVSTVALPKSENKSGKSFSADSPVAQVNVIQVYVVPVKRKRRLRAFDHLPGCPNDAIQFIKTTNFDGSLKQHVFRTAFAINTDECANLCHTHYFCHSAGYQPSSNRCLLSYKRSNIICDWSAAPTPGPNLSDEIRPSSWLLSKGKQDQDDAGFDEEVDDDETDVWLDCFRCGIVYGPNGTNVTGINLNGTVVDSLKHELDTGNFSFFQHSNESIQNDTELGHHLNASNSLEALNATTHNITSLNGTHLNETDLLLSNVTHENATLGNVTDLGHVNLTRLRELVGFNDTVIHNTTETVNQTHVNWTSSVANQSSLANETLTLLGGNDTYSTYHLTFTLLPGNASHDSNQTTNATDFILHSNRSSNFENESLHARLIASLENATSHFNLSQENVTVHLNQTHNLTIHLNLASDVNSTSHENASLETLHILNATIEFDHHQNVTLENSTEHANLTSNDSILHHNLTLDNSSLSSNLTLENATLHVELRSENATIHNNLTLENATLSLNLTSENITSHLLKVNVTFVNVTDLNTTLSLSNVTTGEHNLTWIPDHVNSTTLEPSLLLNVTSESPDAGNATIPFSVTTRRARKFTRRPYTRHVEIVGNFSSAAGAFVGDNEQGF